MSKLVAEFNVTGLPATQGSHQAFVRGNRAVIVPVSAAKLEAWRGAVRAEAKRWMAANGFSESPWDRDTPLSVAIIFRLPEPKQRPRQLLHERRPDLDKLCRAVCDAIGPPRGVGANRTANGGAGLIHDDSRIAILIAAKRWKHTDTPGAEIVVRAALDDDLEEVFACWAS